MKVLNNVKVGTKLIGGFVVIAFLIVIVAVVGFMNMQNINNGMTDLYKERTLPIEELGTINATVMTIQANAFKAIVLQKEDGIEATTSQLLETANKNISDFKNKSTTQEEKDALAKFEPNWNNYQTIVTSIVSKIAIKDWEGAIGLIGKQSTTDTRAAVQESLSTLLEINRRVAKETKIKGDDTFIQSTWIIGIVGGSGLLLAIILGIILSSSITGPLRDGVTMMQELSKGHLSQRLKMERLDEIGILTKAMDQFADDLQNKVIGTMKNIAIGDLSTNVTSTDDQDEISPALNQTISALQEMARAAEQIVAGDLTAEINPRSKNDVLGLAFSKMITNLNSTLQQTNLVTAQVVQAVEQVRSVSQDLASNAQEQSTAVEEVASSVEETDSQVRASAEHANMANQLTSQTTNLANAGQIKMNSLSESITAISRSSQEISKIIKVIDDIAFQTNLLALNAAVEAARAGQYGKGFAVVAQEVRNLAERSAKAAKSTAELIEDSSRRVQEGVTMTGETAQSLNEIVQNVVKVKDLVSEIAAASDEQTKALNQISQAITQVNQGTQSTSSQSEELASTADELGSLAERLKEEVARFKLRQRNGDPLSGLPNGLTPEMLQNALKALQSSGNLQNFKNANSRYGEPGTKNIDRDERGYGNF